MTHLEKLNLLNQILEAYLTGKLVDENQREAARLQVRELNISHMYEFSKQQRNQIQKIIQQYLNQQTVYDESHDELIVQANLRYDWAILDKINEEQNKLTNESEL